MKFTTGAKRAAHWAHTVIGKSPLATRWYFALLSGVLRPLPECKFKRQILNSVLAARWPECDLPPRRVILGTNTWTTLHQDSLNSMGFLRGAGYQFFNITDRGAAKHEKLTASEFRDWLLVPNELLVDTPQLVGRKESR